VVVEWKGMALVVDAGVEVVTLSDGAEREKNANMDAIILVMRLISP
jgi:hypothetical protein